MSFLPYGKSIFNNIFYLSCDISWYYLRIALLFDSILKYLWQRWNKVYRYSTRRDPFPSSLSVFHICFFTERHLLITTRHSWILSLGESYGFLESRTIHAPRRRRSDNYLNIIPVLFSSGQKRKEIGIPNSEESRLSWLFAALGSLIMYYQKLWKSFWMADGTRAWHVDGWERGMRWK